MHHNPAVHNPKDMEMLISPHIPFTKAQMTKL